jgi:hypothetical protein
MPPLSLSTYYFGEKRNPLENQTSKKICKDADSLNRILKVAAHNKKVSTFFIKNRIKTLSDAFSKRITFLYNIP